MRRGEEQSDRGGPNDDSVAVLSGQLNFIPCTSIEGERYMRQTMHDINATSNNMGHPEISLSMTSNLNWPEI